LNRMRWERHLARIGETYVYRIVVGKPERKKLKNPHLEGRINLKYIFKK